MESKLRIPRTFGKVVRREGILHAMRVDGASARFATIVCAPAGSGKTTLMAHRGRQLQAEGEWVAWLSLDQDDNDPFILWSGILGACELALQSAKAGHQPLAGLQPTRDAVTTEFLADFSHAIESLPGRLWLILDDVHELETRQALDGLAKLMRVPPRNLKLMIGCRYDPPLPLARMRLDETAHEIRAADLAFDRAEASMLLKSHNLHLDGEDVDLLLARTEGWAAGLKLVASWIARYDDPKPCLADFIGDERPVADYLVSEVLSHESHETRELLLAVAVPERLSVELADELSGRTDAGAVLEHLAHDNVFVYREGGPHPSYRLHSLLRSYLLAELDRRNADAKRALHSRAAEWFDRHGYTGSALEHATMSADWKSVADLLSKYGLHLVLAGEHRPVDHALTVVPDEILDRPEISLLGAISAMTKGEMATAEDYFERASRRMGVNGDPRSQTVSSVARLYQARMNGAESSHAAAWIDPNARELIERPELQLLVTANRGMIRLKEGDFAGAETDLSDAFNAAVDHRYDLLALDSLAHLTVTAAILDDAAKTRSRIRQALDFADAHGWSSTIPMVPVYLTAAWAAWESLDTERADAMISLAGAVEGDVEPEVVFSLEALRAYIDVVSGDRNVARARAALRRNWGRKVTLPPKAISKHCLTELQLAIAEQNESWLDEALARADTLLTGTVDAGVMHSLAAAHQGRTDQARDGLAPVVVNVEACATPSAEIAAWLLEAHLADLAGKPVSAHKALINALDRAAPVHAKRDVVHAPDRTRSLLVSHRGRFGSHETFVADVIDAIRGGDHPSNTTPAVGGEEMTARELDLLQDLPSLLSLAEIAEAHVVSLNTVKTHLKAIYRKLGVGSRREAVDRARGLGLI